MRGRPSPLAYILALLASALVALQPVAAQSILRDAETEELLNDMVPPLVEASELEPGNVGAVNVRRRLWRTAATILAEGVAPHAAACFGAVVGVFAVAAILTPPDLISQIGLAIPTLLLYEVAILSVRMVEKKHEEERAAREAELG